MMRRQDPHDVRHLTPFPYCHAYQALSILKDDKEIGYAAHF